VYLYSKLPEREVVACHLEPVKDIESTVARIKKEFATTPRIAVLPEGPMTVPYYSSAS